MVEGERKAVVDDAAEDEIEIRDAERGGVGVPVTQRSRDRAHAGRADIEADPVKRTHTSAARGDGMDFEEGRAHLNVGHRSLEFVFQGSIGVDGGDIGRCPSHIERDGCGDAHQACDLLRGDDAPGGPAQNGPGAAKERGRAQVATGLHELQMPARKCRLLGGDVPAQQRGKAGVEDAGLGAA